MKLGYLSLSKYILLIVISSEPQITPTLGQLWGKVPNEKKRYKRGMFLTPF